MAKPPVSSSSPLPPSGSPFPDISLETPQSTTSAEFSQPILPSVLPLTTRSPPEGLVEFNWQPQGAWYGFVSEEEFPPLTLGSPLLSAVMPPNPRHIFDDLMTSSDMDSSSPVGSEELHASTGEYQLFLEDFPYVFGQPSPQSMSNHF